MITLEFGNYIQDVKSGIITYCQRIDLSKIAKILATGRFEEKVEVVIDNDKLGTTADPHGIYKDAITNKIRQTAQDYRDYIKSKEKLTGILRSMTSKELDEKLEQLFTAPIDENKATRFVQGLDPARYSTMQTHFMNELNNGRDIYPTDLTSAVCKANRWLVPSARGYRRWCRTN